MLEIHKLRKVKVQKSSTTAQCPACAEQGQDKKGNHLIVHSDGRFGCVVYPGDPGHSHRQRIFELAGTKDPNYRNTKAPVHNEVKATMEIRPAQRPKPEIIHKNILGHLGRANETHAGKETITEDITLSPPNIIPNADPTVPEKAQEVN